VFVPITAVLPSRLSPLPPLPRENISVCPHYRGITADYRGISVVPITVQLSIMYYYNCFMALWTLSATTQVSWYQKGKTNLDLPEQEQEIVSGSCIMDSMQICILPQRDNHDSIPPLSFYRPGALPATQPTALCVL